MRSARLIPALAVGTGLAVLVAPATAAPKKPITKSFDLTMPVPLAGTAQDPTAAVACGGAANPPSSTQLEKFKAPAAGVLKVEMTGYYGDWDFTVRDAKGKTLSHSDNASVTPTSMSTGNIPEKATVKIKKAGEIQMLFCNFLGGPTGKGKYTFTFAK